MVKYTPRSDLAGLVKGESPAASQSNARLGGRREATTQRLLCGIRNTHNKQHTPSTCNDHCCTFDYFNCCTYFTCSAETALVHLLGFSLFFTSSPFSITKNFVFFSLPNFRAWVLSLCVCVCVLAHWNLTVLSVEKERRTSPAGCDLIFFIHFNDFFWFSSKSSGLFLGSFPNRVIIHFCGDCVRLCRWMLFVIIQTKSPCRSMKCVV
jgi:hypothetical protein